MIIDALLKVSAAQQITGTAVSTNTIDLLATTTQRQIGTGEELGFGCVITAAGTNTGSLTVQAISSASANLGTPTVLDQINIATAGLAAGKQYFVPIPPGSPIQRYLGVNYTVTGTVDVTFDSWLTTRALFSIQAIPYAKSYVV